MGNTPWSNETERAEWYMREYERLRKRQEELPTGGQLIVKGAVLKTKKGADLRPEKSYSGSF